MQVVDVDQVGEDALLVHDAHDEDPSTAFALSRLSHPETLDNTPIGIFRDVPRGTYDAAMTAQIDTGDRPPRRRRPRVAAGRKGHLDRPLTRPCPSPTPPRRSPLWSGSAGLRADQLLSARIMIAGL